MAVPTRLLCKFGSAAVDSVKIAPRSAAHEQVIAVGDGTLTWGWHGDLDEVPAGFATELGIYRGESVSDVLTRWSTDIGPSGDRIRDNPLTTHLSYWTDNGAAYWYRTEADQTIVESVVDTVAAMRADGIPVRAVELDSWWYVHETPPPIVEIGYPRGVPPSGTMRWEPRADAFGPANGEVSIDVLSDVAAQLDGAPLAVHATSPRSRRTSSRV